MGSMNKNRTIGFVWAAIALSIYPSAAPWKASPSAQAQTAQAQAEPEAIRSARKELAAARDG